MQNPHYINPEVGKIPKKVVDKIPLVLYIPSPPDEEEQDSTNATGLATSIPVVYPARAQVPKPEHSYPPKPTKATSRKRRFVFLRRKSAKSVPDAKPSPQPPTLQPQIVDEKPPEVWEDLWDGGDLPFVRLPENRATCAICLLDFAEPKTRVAREVIESWKQGNREKSGQGSSSATLLRTEEGPSTASVTEVEEGTAVPAPSQTEDEGKSQVPSQSPAQQSEVREEPVSTNDVDALRLEDAGEEAQPLRLLACGHVFHVSILTLLSEVLN